MSTSVPRSAAERARICREIVRCLAALPETSEKGALRGLLLRLHLAQQDPAGFEDVFQKLAVVSEKVALDTPAARLHARVESLQARR